MNTTHVWPNELALVDGEWLVSSMVEFPDGDQKPIRFRVPEELGYAISDRHDHFLLAAIFSAMKAGQACHVHGQVTESLLVNLSEFSAIWNVWVPLDYNSLALSADSVLPSRSLNNRAWIAAFSGGVDACATLMRHTKEPIGLRTRPVKACLLLQGLDIPENNPEAFTVAQLSAQTIASSVGVSLHTLKTNSRSLGDNWEHAFGALVLACLNVLSSGYDGAVLSGDNSPYAQQRIPWGSNAISNYLLGSDYFPLYTDSGELSRLQKVGSLRNWPEALGNLRVCWEGPMTGTNCGLCEKCIRTQLEFLVQGIDASASFAHTFQPGDILKIAPHSLDHVDILVDILSTCEHENFSAWWVDELRTVVERGVRVKKNTIVSRFRAKLKIGTRLREVTMRRKFIPRQSAPNIIQP